MRKNAFIAIALVSLVGPVLVGSQTGLDTNAPGATIEQFDRWMVELSNWGRWGADDQLGTANLITPEKRVQAAALVQTGESISLGHSVADAVGSDRANPFSLNMIISFDPDRIRDRLDIDYHGGFFTHLDALCHVVREPQVFPECTHHRRGHGV